MSCQRCDERGRTILMLQRSLEEKNKELDALGYVWCDGVCPGGVYRHTEGKLTEELVSRAERAVLRMRRRLTNQQGFAAERGAWRGETCRRCGRRNVIGFRVSDEVWNAVVQDRFGVVCPGCFDRMAEAVGIRYQFLEVFPLSWSMWEAEAVTERREP